MGTEGYSGFAFRSAHGLTGAVPLTFLPSRLTLNKATILAVVAAEKLTPDGLAINKNLSPSCDGRPQFLLRTLAPVK